MAPVEEHPKKKAQGINGRIWENLNSYERSEYLSNYAPDCSFAVGIENPKIFHCHKWILQCASPVFGTMFTSFFKEANNSNEIPITDIEPHIFKKFTDFIYNDDFEVLKHFDFKMLKALLYLGKRFLIPQLTDACLAVIKESLKSFENHEVLCAFEYAFFEEDEDLIQECKEIIKQRASQNIFKANIDNSTENVFGNSSTFLGANSSANQPAFARLKRREEKEVLVPHNVSFNFGNNLQFGVRDDITKCMYIFDLSPSIFHEFQKTLIDIISELQRFTLIETYVKINGLYEENDLIDQNIIAKIINNENSSTESISGNSDVKNINRPDQIHEQQQQQQNFSIKSPKHLVNIMLQTIKYHKMTPKEFCCGPGISSLLSLEEKNEILLNLCRSFYSKMETIN